jgi:hypothetical protein
MFLPISFVVRSVDFGPKHLVWHESLLSVQEKEGSCCLPGKEGAADVEVIGASQTPIIRASLSVRMKQRNRRVASKE